jgi:hypothetical protein
METQAAILMTAPAGAQVPPQPDIFWNWKERHLEKLVELRYKRTIPENPGLHQRFLGDLT